MTFPTKHAAIAALFLGATTLAATDAAAHATLETAEVAAGTTYKAVMRIPHGCDGKPTTAVSIEIPEGVIAAKPMPKAGWNLETEWGAYATTHDYYGTPMSEGVRLIRWSGGELPDDFYDEFVFRARITGGLAGHTLAFKTVQDCPGGARVAWTEIAAPGQDPHDLARPAPTLTVLAANKGGHGHNHGAAPAGITVDAPFARASAGPVKNGAAYLTIRNSGDAPDRLIAAKAPVSERAELHTHLHEDGVMKMRKVEAVEVPAGGEAALKPGGDHVMLMGLHAPLKEGETFPLTLVFETAGEVTVTVTIGSVGASSGHGDHSHHGSHGTQKSD